MFLLRLEGIVFSAKDWQLRYLFQLGCHSWLIHIAVACLTGYILHDAQPGAVWSKIWVGVMLAASMMMVCICWFFSLRAEKETDGLQRGGYLHSIVTSIVGIIWGVGAFGAAGVNFEVLSLYSLALGGTALGAVSSQHSVPRSALTSIWSSIPLLAMAHYRHPDNVTALPITLMILLYAAVLSILSVRMFRFLSTNHELSESLSAKVLEMKEASSQLEIARRQAEEANLSKSRFLAQASHDLRQPIHAVGLLTASLQDTRLNSEQRKLVDTIERSIESVMNLFGSLLDISRLEVGGVAAKPDPVDLGQFLTRIVEQNQQFANSNGCSLVVVQTQQWVTTDANLLFMMVQNVLGNAFKYAPGSRVIIGPRRQRGRIAIQICDTGPGIAPAQVETVFDEFYRLDSTPGRSVEGMGLGLTIVRMLADLLNVEVSLTSQVGKGTSIVIAGLEKTVPQQVKPVARVRSHPLAGKHICLIDDDAAVRAATSRLLERWGCTVEASSGAATASGDCDAIIADLQLGEADDGLAAVMSLREKAKRPIPAVILTGDVGLESTERLAASGIPVLHKPVRAVELRSMLTRLSMEIGDQKS